MFLAGQPDDHQQPKMCIPPERIAVAARLRSESLALNAAMSLLALRVGITTVLSSIPIRFTWACAFSVAHGCEGASMHSIAPHRLLRRSGLSASSSVAHAPAPLITTQIALPCTLVLAPERRRISSEGAVAVALLIDGENCSPDLVATALVEAARYGNVAIRRLYANPTVISQQRWQSMLTSHQIEAVHHERTAIGKNATDIALVVEAMDLLHQGTIGCFCLLASDSDYTPLVKRLRAAGRVVIGIGRAQTPPALTQACSIFIALDRCDTTASPPAVTPGHPTVQLGAPAQSDPQARAPTTPCPQPDRSAPRPEQADPTAMLLASWRAVHQMLGVVSLSSLVFEIQLLFPALKPQTYGYDSFATARTLYHPARSKPCAAPHC